MAPMETDVVGNRVSSKVFQALPQGSPARVAGRCEDGSVLMTTDGGNVKVSLKEGLDASGRFVELVGTKGPEGQLCATEVFKFPAGEVDAELWEEHLKLTQLPQFAELFKPLGAA
eukprot:TRINITY_DN79429_c0_g1_i1.p1 TRINITY_DN79429_c0_g1~~TRINITY_DN79429_c0_g1_i1.p1  ORF type:complete len:115 (+),score=21.27 TRINITY_DN79429_c0_g1_i1:119-463(+)